MKYDYLILVGVGCSSMYLADSKSGKVGILLETIFQNGLVFLLMSRQTIPHDVNVGHCGYFDSSYIDIKPVSKMLEIGLHLHSTLYFNYIAA